MGEILSFLAVHGSTKMLTIPLKETPADWRVVRLTLSASICLLLATVSISAAFVAVAYGLNLFVTYWPF